MPAVRWLLQTRAPRRMADSACGRYGDCDYAYYDDYSYRDRRGSDWPRDHYDGYWGDTRSWGYGERGKGYGPSASNPRDRDRFITQMMEDERYHWRKQHDPDFIGSLSAMSGGSSTKSKDHEGGDGDDDADKFDAKLEKRRKHRADMKQKALSKPDRLVGYGCPTGACERRAC